MGTSSSTRQPRQIYPTIRVFSSWSKQKPQTLARMPILLRAQKPADFLALLPALLGQDPRNSVVLVTFSGSTTNAGLRFDLPQGSGSHSKTVHKRLATALTGYLCKIRDVDYAMIVVVTDESFGETATPPHADLAAALESKIEQAGFHLGNVFCLASDGWGSYSVGEAPPGGHPLTEITESRAARGMPAEGLLGLAARALPAWVPDADETTRAQVRRELDLLRGLIRGLRLNDDIPYEFEPIHDCPRLAEDALGWSHARFERESSLLLFAIQSPPLRDLIMLQWASDLATGERLWEGTKRYAEEGIPFDDGLADIMLGVGRRPDPERIERGIALLLKLVAGADDGVRCAPLCMIAWLHWTLGRGSNAGVYLDEVLAIDGRYGMGELLATILYNGLLPEWAFEPGPSETAAGTDTTVAFVGAEN